MALRRYPRSLSGIELDGDSIVRQVYLDESGISANESMTVVAGLIIDPDKQWKLVAEYLNSLLIEYVPVEHLESRIQPLKLQSQSRQLLLPKSKLSLRFRTILAFHIRQ